MGIHGDVVGGPIVMPPLRPGGRRTGSGSVTPPYEEAAFSDHEGDVALAVLVEVSDPRWTYGPTSRELRPTIVRKRSHPRLVTSGIDGMEVVVGRSLEDLLEPVTVDVCRTRSGKELQVIHFSGEGRELIAGCCLIRSR
jgi:hypothetical protein